MLLCVPPCLGPRGPFNRLGYMDDTTWCLDSEPDLPVFADNVQRARLPNNLFLSGPKQLLVVATLEKFPTTFHPRHVLCASGLSRRCRAHGTDHDTFSVFTFSLPQSPRNTRSVTSCAEWCMRGTRPPSTSEWMLAISAYGMRMPPPCRWPHGCGIWRVFLPSMGSNPLLPVSPTIRSVMRHVGFVTDCSWFPSHRCGGGGLL